MKTLARHPDEIQLALLAGGDLGFWSRWHVRRHIAHCPECTAEFAALQSGREQVRELCTEMPAGVNWPRLTQEMTGNIRVGLAAGECIAGFEKSPRAARTFAGSHKQGLVWNAAMVLACATVIAIAALWIQLPRQEIDRLMGSLQKIRFDRIGHVVRGPALVEEGVVLEASPLSIGIKENGGAMPLLHPRSDGAAVSVSMQGSAGVRYVDADTGQVTTNRVYYAQ